jgi:hypothetical protein
MAGPQGKAHMDSNSELVPPAPVAPRQTSLAIASLALGILACALSLFVIGILFGLVGLFLGLLHVLMKRGPNGMAFWGIGLSILSVLAGRDSARIITPFILITLEHGNRAREEYGRS